MDQNASISPIEILPNEILVKLFNLLGPSDLCSASLLAKRLNDIVSSVLYRNLFWKEPLHPHASAFRRRPWLQNSVRQLVIDDATWNSTQILEICEELARFPLLSKIIWMRRPLYGERKFDFYIDTLTQLDNVKHIHIPIVPYHYNIPGVFDEFCKLGKITSIALNQEIKDDQKWFQITGPHLISLIQMGYPYGPQHTYLYGCRNLQKLVVKYMNSLVILIQQLTDLRQLRTLDLEFKYATLRDFGNSVINTLGLDQLETLHLRSDGTGGELKYNRWLCKLYECLALNSHCLQDLQFLLSNNGSYFFERGGDTFIKSIAKHHRASIRSFGLSGFLVSEPALARFIRECPRLEELRFQPNTKNLTGIGLILGSSRELRVIRMAIPTRKHASGPESHNISSILMQTMPRVCVFHLRAVWRYKIWYLSWKARWVYDEVLQRPQRQVEYVQRYNVIYTGQRQEVLDGTDSW